jgi:hypothetical protein
MKNWIFIAAIAFLHIVNAQTTEVVKRDTVVYDGYEGSFNFTLRKVAEEMVLQGPVSFDSKLLVQYENDTIWFKELDINGAYSGGKRNGVWKYDFDSYYLNSPSLQKRWDVRLNFRLDGNETSYTLGYKDGMRQGRWEKRIREVVAGRFRPAETVIRFEFDKNVLVGSFSGEREFPGIGKVRVSGNLNGSGFFHGDLMLRYHEEGQCIEETRTYSNGFLMRLEKKECAGDIIQTIQFNDVEEALELMKTQEEKALFTISDEGFGLRFNNGYPESSAQLKSQAQGNRIMEALFNLFNPFCESDASPVLKLTRRFKYFYPEYEDSIISIRLSETKQLKSELIGFLDRPNFRMRKSNNDSLVKAFYQLEVALEKLTILEMALTQMKEGFFDYRNRNVYYKDGIPGLNESDSITFSFQGKDYNVPFVMKNLVNSPDQLLEQIEFFLGEMRMVYEGWKNLVVKSLTIYENQEFIDSLDSQIGKFEILMRKAYEGIDEKRNQKHEDLDYSYRLFLSVEERLLAPASAEYLENNLPFEIASETGKTISCLMEFLSKNKEELDRVGRLGRIWNDSLFTIEEENPFDFRPFVTKILGGVQQGGTILFRHYATRLLNARSCQAMQEELILIRQLESRMRYLARNHENPQVQLLDRTLRRERVPARLERILELR